MCDRGRLAMDNAIMNLKTITAKINFAQILKISKMKK